MERIPELRCRSGVRRVLCLAFIAAAVLASAGTGGSASQAPLLAAVGQGSATRLSAVDPLTLRPVGRSTQIGRFNEPAARSPDGTRLVLGSQGPTAGLRFIDLRRMRTLRAVEVGGSFVEAINWVS